MIKLVLYAKYEVLRCNDVKQIHNTKHYESPQPTKTCSKQNNDRKTFNEGYPYDLEQAFVFWDRALDKK